MIFIGYRTNTEEIITGSVENTNSAIDTGIATLKTTYANDNNVLEYIIAAGESEENYVVIGYVDP